METTEKLGVDIGGVIIDRVNDNTDTSFFGDNFLNTTPTPGVFEALRKLVDRFGQERVYLVSKCGRKVQDKTLLWLDHHNFYARTGIFRGNIRFCKERHQKAGICEALGITHFIDDRLEILGYLTTVKHRFLFQSNHVEVSRHRQHLNKVTLADNWNDIQRLILQ